MPDEDYFDPDDYSRGHVDCTTCGREIPDGKFLCPFCSKKAIVPNEVLEK